MRYTAKIFLWYRTYQQNYTSSYSREQHLHSHYDGNVQFHMLVTVYCLQTIYSVSFEVFTVEEQTFLFWAIMPCLSAIKS
jgi:hypothetical protein